MRDFSVIQTRFWIDPAMKALSRDSRLIALYLATGPHTTMLGCFRCPKSYIAEDLDCSLAEVEASFAALAAFDFFTFDEATGWCVVHDFLKWNPIHNPSHALGIEKLFEQVPKQGVVFKKLCSLLQDVPKYLRSEFSKNLKTVSRACADGVETVSRRSRHTDTDTEKDTDTETERDTEKDTEIQHRTRKEQEGKRGVLPSIVALARRCEGPPPPILAVFDYWKTTLGHPQAVLDSKRKQLIQQALKWGYRIDQLRDAIRGCSLTPYNMGSNERGQRYDGLHLILRSADQIDRFIQNALNPPQPRNAAYRLLEGNLAAGQQWLQRKMTEVPHGNA